MIEFLYDIDLGAFYKLVGTVPVLSILALHSFIVSKVVTYCAYHCGIFLPNNTLSLSLYVTRQVKIVMLLYIATCIYVLPLF